MREPGCKDTLTHGKPLCNPKHACYGVTVPEWLMRRRELNWTAKALYGRLVSYYNPEHRCAFPSVKTLANDLGRSEREVVRLLSLLRTLELIIVLCRRYRGVRATNVYVFPVHAWNVDPGQYVGVPEDVELPTERVLRSTTGHKRPADGKRVTLRDDQRMRASYRQDAQSDDLVSCGPGVVSCGSQQACQPQDTNGVMDSQHREMIGCAPQDTKPTGHPRRQPQDIHDVGQKPFVSQTTLSGISVGSPPQGRERHSLSKSKKGGEGRSYADRVIDWFDQEHVVARGEHYCPEYGDQHRAQESWAIASRLADFEVDEKGLPASKHDELAEAVVRHWARRLFRMDGYVADRGYTLSAVERCRGQLGTPFRVVRPDQPVAPAVAPRHAARVDDGKYLSPSELATQWDRMKRLATTGRE